MRIIFIPGFAEDEVVFSKLAPLIGGDKLVLNSWKLLGDQRRDNFNVLTFAQEFISTYKITSSDVLIGHSMGGWIAYHVKHLAGCHIVQIASMTNKDRIIPPVANHPVVYWAVRKGLVFNRFTIWISSLGFYHHGYSKQIFMYFAGLLLKGNRENIVNQVKVLLNPVAPAVLVQPDLRIHGKQDNILKQPKDPHYLVDGDHFILYTNPAAVSVPIIQFLQGIREPVKGDQIV